MAAVVVATVLASGVMHDYGAYLAQWSVACRGLDPWGPVFRDDGRRTFNAYGPAFLLFGFPSLVHPLLPKLIFGGLAVGIYATLIRASTRAGVPPSVRRLAFIALLFVLSPLVVVAVYFLGNNDIVAAFCVLMACTARTKGRSTEVGVWLGVGALTKFYPILFVAFVAARRDRSLDLRAPLVALLVFGVGMAMVHGIWGSSAFTPLLYGADRGPKMLSILNTLQNIDSWGSHPVLQHLIRANARYVVGAAMLVALHGWRARLPWEITLMVGALAIFLVYKTGHPQFYLSWLIVHAWVLASHAGGPAHRVARALIPVAVVLGLYQVLYLASYYVDGSYLKDDWAFIRYASAPVMWVAAVLGVVRARQDIFRSWGPITSNGSTPDPRS